MADVYIAFGTLLALGIVFPGMLTAWWLLFPNVIDRGRTRIEATPWRCLFLGIVMTVALVVPIGVFSALPFGPAQFLGIMTGLSALAFASLGAAAIAAAMGARLILRSEGSLTNGKAYIGGAVTLALAAAFPAIGWFIVIPLAIVTSLGAATFAALNWMPGEKRTTVPDAVPSQA